MDSIEMSLNSSARSCVYGRRRFLPVSFHRAVVAKAERLRNRNSSSPLIVIAMESRSLRRVTLEKQHVRTESSWDQHGFQCTRDFYPSSEINRRSLHLCQALVDDRNVSDEAIAGQAREFLEETSSGEQSFFERLALAWSILFPSKRKPSSNAEVAKQRLKMILISDRCSVNDEAKRRIVNNIVGALSDFVEIESEDKVQLTVSSDPAVGTVYSVTVPVRRVKPEYQEYSGVLKNVAIADEFANEFRTLDIKLEYPDAVDAQSS